MKQDEFELEEDEDMDSDSSVSDTSIDSTMLSDVLSDSDEMSKDESDVSSCEDEEEATTNKKSNKRKLAEIEDLVGKSKKRPLAEISNINYSHMVLRPK